MADNEELDPSTYLFENSNPEPRRDYVKNLTAEWIGKKVRVRVSGTLIVEDVLSGVYHFSGTTRLYFANTKAFKSFLSSDEGYMASADELVGDDRMTVTFTYRDGTTTTDAIEWAKKFEEHDYRRVALDTIPGALVVSTIWQGLPDCVFETVVVSGADILFRMRSNTEQEALDTHNEAIHAYTEEPS